MDAVADDIRKAGGLTDDPGVPSVLDFFEEDEVDDE